MTQCFNIRDISLPFSIRESSSSQLNNRDLNALPSNDKDSSSSLLNNSFDSDYKDIFDFFDTDGDGYLVKSEINKLLDMLDIINATVDELELLIVVLENQDGRLSFGDFMNLLGR